MTWHVPRPLAVCGAVISLPEDVKVGRDGSLLLRKREQAETLPYLRFYLPSGAYPPRVNG